jgi:biotin operon repressor
MEIKKFWETLPENAVKLENTFLSYIPLDPLCISSKNLREQLGITKQTLSYHIKKHKKSITIFIVKKKHYYQRRNEA